ncbi:MAG: F0F1 ATP synthase subunit A [Phycisphaeraceae bacterium]
MISSLNPNLAASDLLTYAIPRPLFGDNIPFSNLDLMAIVAAVTVFVTFWWVSKRVRVGSEAGNEAYMTRGRGAQLFEVLLVFIREEVVRPNLGKLTDKYIYYIWTVFFFILFSNVLGIVPFGPTLQSLAVLFGSEDPYYWGRWGGSATSTLSMNIPLALVSFVAIVFIGVKENGKHFFAHFAPVPFTPLPMAPIALLLVVLEVLGLIIKCVVLAMRLFGTMMAGNLVILAVVGLIFTAGEVSTAMGYGVVLPVMVGGLGVMILELFIAVLQAFIFTFLTTLFIASGAVHHEEHEHEEREEAAHELVETAQKA